MAPEQAAGEPNIDQRVDIYALGVLGYELITGRTPFSGRTSQEVLAAHVTQPPVPLGQHRPACPAELEAVIMKCLAKRPADRWQTADELLAQLEPLAHAERGNDADDDSADEVGEHQPRSLPVPSRWLVVAALLLVVVGIAALRLEPSLARDPAGPAAAAHAGHRDWSWIPRSLPTEAGGVRHRSAGPNPALRAAGGGGGNPVAITPEGQGFARMPRWSPDGQRLVFSSDRGIELIPALGGTPRLLVPLPAGGWLDAAWSPDGKSIVYASGDSVLVRAVDGSTSPRPGPADRGALLQLVARRALDRLRLGQPPVRAQRGLRQHRHQQHLGDPIRGRERRSG